MRGSELIMLYGVLGGRRVYVVEMILVCTLIVLVMQ